MNPEDDAELCGRFPKLYADRHASMRSTAMCWGFDVGPGWKDLIFKLSEKLEPLIEALGPDYPCYCGESKDAHPVEHCSEYKPSWPRASQVKTKFGGLRFYMTCETEEMGDLISEAERVSHETCEDCGQPGEYYVPHGWVWTLCKDCQPKHV